MLFPDNYSAYRVQSPAKPKVHIQGAIHKQIKTLASHTSNERWCCQGCLLLVMSQYHMQAPTECSLTLKMLLKRFVWRTRTLEACARSSTTVGSALPTCYSSALQRPLLKMKEKYQSFSLKACKQTYQSVSVAMGNCESLLLPCCLITLILHSYRKM